MVSIFKKMSKKDIILLSACFINVSCLSSAVPDSPKIYGDYELSSIRCAASADSKSFAEPTSSAVSQADHVTTSQVRKDQDYGVRWIETDQLQSICVGDKEILFKDIPSVPAGKPPEFRPGLGEEPLEYPKYSLKSVHDKLALNEAALKGNIGKH